MKFVNLTPHVINIFDINTNLVNIVPTSGLVARIDTDSFLVGTLGESVPAYFTSVTGEPLLINQATKETVDFPEQTEGVIYIVSGMFRQYFDRPDLYQPGKLLRDESGKPIGCVGLSR